MPQPRPRVLIVDDEDNIVLALHRVLYQDNHRYDVLLAKSAEIAQTIIQDRHVDVMVTDVHLPGMSGMELLCWAAIESPTTRVIVMTAFDITNIKDRAHAFGCLRLARKPFDVHEMRATIGTALERRDGFAGNLSELSLIDVIQMLCISRRSTTLRVSEGNRSGVMVFEGGEIVHAIWNDLIGEEAFYEMMAVTDGLFTTAMSPPDVERTIQEGWQGLLMEGIRRQDERGRDSSEFENERAATSSKPSRTSYMPARGTTPLTVDHLIDQGFTALRSGKHDEALRYWEEGLRTDPTNRMLELNIRKLQGKLTR